jgi:hypothetical protein
MISVSSPLEFTAVAAVVESNGYVGQSTQLIGTDSNTSGSPGCLSASGGRGASVDSTVQFIRAHYDSLFKRLAD